jgi:ribose-phosphate pyrophosphokinase
MNFNFRSVKVFSTRGTQVLAEEVCKELDKRIPPFLKSDEELALSKVKVERFSNENLQVQVENVRGSFVVIIHTQVPPVSDGIIELFALLDAVENARPADILLVFPYMPYSRSDRKNKPRISVMGNKLPHIFSNSFGVKRVLLLDPHDTHIKHYFEPAADEITAIYLLVDYIQHNIISGMKNREEAVIVFADAGSAKRFENVPALLNVPTAYIDKGRLDDKENPVLKRVVGEVGGKTCFLFDDEILTGGTAVRDADILKKEGAKSVIMFAVHPILNDKDKGSQEVIKKLENSPFEKIVVTETVPVQHKLKGNSRFVVLPVSGLLAEAIKRFVMNESLTELHNPENVNLYRNYCY